MNPKQPSGAGAPTASIMVVDDTPANLQVLAGMLKERGYRVRPVPSGKLALLAALSDPPDLILLDINMPEMNGYDVCQRLKSDDRLRAIPVIFISILSEPLDKVKAFSMGGVDYVSTPYQTEELHARIETHLKLRRLQVELEDANARLATANGVLARKQAELSDLHLRKDEFLAMLSHELRGPLAPIVNAIDLLRLETDASPLQCQARTIIERQVAQLARLVDDLMEVSRISTGRIHLRQDHVMVSVIVERAVETVRPLIDQRGHNLSVLLPPDPIWLHADAARLQQVIVNLLTNAAKYTPDRGRIQLSVEREGKESVLRVLDTGVGISPELLPHIFDLFTQAERSLDRSEGGLGIGLALVQRIVEMHQGKVEVFSSPGQGAEFVMRLPAVPPPPVPPASCLESPQLVSQHLRILVVDDNVDTAQTLALLLKKLGHDVHMAHTGPAALQATNDYQPSILLLDIGMPGLNGYEVAEQIRAQPLLDSVVLVAITGYGRETDRELTRHAGFDHHLVKPTDFGQLKRILATVSNKTRVL